MSAFTGPLVIEEVEPGRLWRLVQPIRYEAGEKGSGRLIEVPAGFETDGASIPAFLRVFLAVWGTYGRAACLHDYMYSILRYGYLWIDADSDEIDRMHPAFEAWPGKSALDYVVYSGDDKAYVKFRRAARRWADSEFYAAMRACGTSKPLAWLIWATVRLFGSSYAGAKNGS